MGKIYPLCVPKGIDQGLWAVFISGVCSRCETPTGGCRDGIAIVGQARKCFDEWLKQSMEDAKDFPEESDVNEAEIR